MRFLLRLLLHCLNWFVPASRIRDAKDPQSARSEELEGDDLVARFIYSRSQIRLSDQRPKPQVFNPSPHNELSVVHSTGLGDGEIWSIGRHTLGTEPGRSRIHGRADIPVHVVKEKNLRVIRDNDPFDRHTAITGWPRGRNPDETKQIWKQICLELSQDPEIKLQLPDTPITFKANSVSEV